MMIIAMQQLQLTWYLLVLITVLGNIALTGSTGQVRILDVTSHPLQSLKGIGTSKVAIYIVTVDMHTSN